MYGCVSKTPSEANPEAPKHSIGYGSGSFHRYGSVVFHTYGSGSAPGYGTLFAWSDNLVYVTFCPRGYVHRGGAPQCMEVLLASAAPS